MITTVTAVTTVTTVTTIAGISLTAVTSITAVVLLMFFLVTRELAGAGQSMSSRLISRSVSVGIIPLIMVFAVLVAIRIVEVLS